MVRRIYQNQANTLMPVRRWNSRVQFRSVRPVVMSLSSRHESFPSFLWVKFYRYPLGEQSLVFAETTITKLRSTPKELDGIVSAERGHANLHRPIMLVA